MARSGTRGNNQGAFPGKPPSNAETEKVERLKDELHVQSLDLETQCEAMQEAIADLEESRRRYADLYDFAPAGYLTTDEKGCITEINLAGAALFGRERSQLIGLPLTVFVDKDSYHLLFEHLRRCVRSGRKTITELRISSKTAKLKYAQFVTMPSPDGGSPEYRTVIVDVTELRSAEAEIVSLLATEKMMQANEVQMKFFADELAATNIELKAFAYIIAHDFRTPMVNLKGYSRELGDAMADLAQIIGDPVLGLPENSRIKAKRLLETDMPEAMGFIDSSVDRLSRMVDALLKLARLGRRELHRREVDLGKLVAGAIDSFGPQIEQLGAAVSVGPLPQIETDQLAMEQIFGNLLDNAVKFLDPERRGEIAVSCAVEGDDYIFCVEDNGRSIAAADLEKIFDLFKRAGKQDVPGEGMGLAYVRTLVRQLGGKVWCESTPDVGTKMCFMVHVAPVVPTTGRLSPGDVE